MILSKQVNFGFNIRFLFFVYCVKPHTCDVNHLHFFRIIYNVLSCQIPSHLYDCFMNDKESTLRFCKTSLKVCMLQQNDSLNFL